MDSSNDDGTIDTHTTQESDTTVKTRGATRMKKVILQRATSRKHAIEFDGLDPVYGSSGNAFKKYVALLGRNNVRITIESWPKVPNETKELILQDILSTYDILNTSATKTHWMQYVDDRWKDFKTKLVNKYIYGRLSYQSPCDKYSFIEQDT